MVHVSKYYERLCISVTVLLCHYKLSSGRSVSEAALRFGNLCVYESNALWKKLPNLLHSCAANTFRRNVPNVNVIFFDAYHRFTMGDLGMRLVQYVCSEDETSCNAGIGMGLVFVYMGPEM